jgi:hypothetical protein
MHSHCEPRLNANARSGPILLKLSADEFGSKDALRRDRPIQDNPRTFQLALYSSFAKIRSSFGIRAQFGLPGSGRLA